jgi:HAD superfamily hydrolase (TIGR01509 family)
VIFDMDGVLVNTEPTNIGYVLSLFRHFDICISPEDVASLVGNNNRAYWEIVASLWNKTISPEDAERIYFENINEKDLNYSKLINPYVKEVLKFLEDDGFKLAIASSSSELEIQDMVKQCEIETYFDIMVSGNRFKESKPNPEIYLYVMKVLKIKPENCVIIEDSSYGIAAGKRSGAYVIALKDKQFQIDQSKADYIADDLLDAYQKISSLK